MAHHLIGDMIEATLAKLRRQGQREGDIDRLAELVTRVLELRSVPLSYRSIFRIARSADPEELLHWFDRALEAAREDPIFAAEDLPLSPTARQLHEDGRAAGALARQQTLILRIWSKPEDQLDPGIVDRIRSCQDRAQLDRWFERAVRGEGPEAVSATIRGA